MSRRKLNYKPRTRRRNRKRETNVIKENNTMSFKGTGGRGKKRRI